MRKNITIQQRVKGLFYLENARQSIVKYYKQILEWKRLCEMDYFLGYTNEFRIQRIKQNLQSAKERVARLERKYL